MKLSWRLGIISAVFLAVFCLYPQLKLMYLRGENWNGHYAYNDIDEVAYAAYLKALIDGRPRKNDPYSGRDDSVDDPQAESLFSIQFAAPYSIALPSRVLGIDITTAMIISGVLAGFLAALAAFWLVAKITGSSFFGMAASLVIFAGGSLAAGEGAVLEILLDGFSYPYFPGFRRYVPAMAISAVFAMFGFVWKVLSQEDRSQKFSWQTIGFCFMAALAFSYTVFSYFYIWTTAAAWFACLVVVWVIERPDGWRFDFKKLGLIAAAMLLALIPYGYLLSKRSDTLEHVQLLVHSRQPDLFRFPEYIAFAVLLILIAGLALKRFKLQDRAALFTLSLALVPFVLFNQQIVTGRSLQPIHYQVFIGNYIAATALMLSIGLVFRQNLSSSLAKVLCGVLAVCAIVWGFVECHYTVRVLDEANIARDEALPIARRLAEIGRSQPDPTKQTVLVFDSIVSDDLPSITMQNVLWARHQHIFAGLSWQESKERYYAFLHFSNVDERGLDYLLKNDFVSQIAMFGWGRHSNRLTSESKGITYGEVAEEVRKYGEFRRDFDRDRAANPPLSFVVLNNESEQDLTVLDTWYERLDPEQFGKYTLYELKPRK